MLSVIEVVRVYSCNSFLKFSRCIIHQLLDIEGFKDVKESAREGFQNHKVFKDMSCVVESRLSEFQVKCKRIALVGFCQNLA